MTADAQSPVVPTYQGRPLDHPDEPVFDQGLRLDLETVVARRQLAKLICCGASSAGLQARAESTMRFPDTRPMSRAEQGMEAASVRRCA